jgi:hypothetical protein
MYRDILLILLIVMLFVLGFMKQCGVIGITAFFVTMKLFSPSGILLSS